MKFHQADGGRLRDAGLYLFVTLAHDRVSYAELIRAYEPDTVLAAKSRAERLGIESFHLYRITGECDDLKFERVELDPPRHQLHFGPYQPPDVEVGQYVECARLGRVRIVAWSTGTIRWPIGRSGKRWSLVLFDDLADAVRREAGPAVMHWWGFCQATLWRFRKALGVTAHNEGMRRLRASFVDQPWFKRTLLAAWAKAQDPQRIKKIAASHRGKPRPSHVIEAIRKANLGRKPTAAARARMSAAQKRRGVRPPKAGRPWMAEEDAALRKYPIAEVMRLTGRTKAAVTSRRRDLGLPDRRKTRGRVLD